MNGSLDMTALETKVSSLKREDVNGGAAGCILTSDVDFVQIAPHGRDRSSSV